MFKNIKKFFIKTKKELSTLEYIDSGSLFYSKIAIYTGEGEAALPHLKIWLPVLEKYGYDICIITRTRKAFRILKEYYVNRNIIYAKSPQDLEEILNNLNLKIIFYTSNTGNNLHICRFKEYRHIFLGHGDSNKSGSAHNGFKLYDEVWVSGQAHIDRFKHAGIDMTGTPLKIIGQPQLDCVHKTTAPSNSFLYIPTWEGTYKEQSYSSLPISQEMFCANKMFYELAIKPHPMTGTKNKKYTTLLSNLIESLRNEHIKVKIYPQNINVVDIMPEHTIYICDNSACVTNALFFNHPIFIYIPKGSNYADTDIQFQEFAYTFSDAEEFIACVEEYQQNGDTLMKERAQILNYFISTEAMSNNSFKTFIDEILNASNLG